MLGIHSLPHMQNAWPQNPFSELPSPSVLFDRVTANWKVKLMDASTVIAVCGFAFTFFFAQSFLCAAFLLTAVASGVAAFYMRQFSELKDIEETAKDLKETKDKLEEVAKNLQSENQQLSESNRQLQLNNAAFQQNNTTLNHQVAQLTLQVTQLRESAGRIRSEVVRFEQENSHLHNHVTGFGESLRVIDQQILNSRALCDQIATHLSSQEAGLDRQLDLLGRYLAELRADNRVNERIQELASLQREAMQATQQLHEATQQLHEIQLQYATERANFQTLHQALVQLKDQFDAAIRDAASNNQNLRENVTALSEERRRIQQIINQHFGASVSR